MVITSIFFLISYFPPMHTNKIFQPGKAWFCTILSAFGVLILTPIAHLFNSNHESFVGSVNDPEDGPAYVFDSEYHQRIQSGNLSPFFLLNY